MPKYNKTQPTIFNESIELTELTLSKPIEDDKYNVNYIENIEFDEEYEKKIIDKIIVDKCYNLNYQYKINKIKYLYKCLKIPRLHF